MWDELIRQESLHSGRRKTQHSVNYVVYEERAHDHKLSHSHPQFRRFTQGTPGTMTPPFSDQNGLHFQTRAFLRKPE